MNCGINVSSDTGNFSKLYPSVIVEACGGAQKFDKLKIMDESHLTESYGYLNREAVTEPIMIGINQNRRVFIILTFDVYDSQQEKIAKKISEIFCDSPCVYEGNDGVGKWQASYQIYGDIYSGYDMPVLEIAKRIQLLLNGDSVEESHRFNYGDVSYIKLWKKESQ